MLIKDKRYQSCPQFQTLDEEKDEKKVKQVITNVRSSRALTQVISNDLRLSPYFTNVRSSQIISDHLVHFLRSPRRRRTQGW